MPQSNRRIVNEAYDPRQRIVGGIVLFLIVLLVYLILKLFINFVAVSDNTTLQEILQARRATVMQTSTATDAGATEASDATASAQAITPNRALPVGFVFLDLNGEPVDREQRQPSVTQVGSASDNFADVSSSGEWYVQVASFREESRAQRLVEQIRDKGVSPTAFITATEIQGREWYVVQLPPQATRQAAMQQRRLVNNTLSVQSIVKQIN